jgi:hypothetical protein
MSVPANPTVTGICTRGLERGGQYNPNSDQITLAAEDFLQEVKADIMRVAPFNRLFAVTATTTTKRGQQRYAIPADHNQSLTLYLLDGPDDWRGTAVTGGSISLTVDSTFQGTDDTITGKWIILTGNGTGTGQYRQILFFNDSLRQIVVDTAWTTVPDSSTTFLIAQERFCLYPDNFDELFTHYLSQEPPVSRPRRCAMFNQEFYLMPVPDKSTYGLVHHYYADLSKVDESSTLFIQLLREWRSLWIQGIAAYTAQRYDDERFPAFWSLYQAQLQRLAYDSPQYTQCEGSR